MAGTGDAKTGSAPSGALLLLVACAGMTGAAGVALAAVAAHTIDSPALATAAMMLMIHAAAALALIAIAARCRKPRLWLGLSGLMLAAVALFAGDVALNAFTGSHIFPMAAPAGGSLLIASWFAVTVAAILNWRERTGP